MIRYEGPAGKVGSSGIFAAMYQACMAWKPMGRPTVREQRGKSVVRIDGVDTAHADGSIRRAAAASDTGPLPNAHSPRHERTRSLWQA